MFQDRQSENRICQRISIQGKQNNISSENLEKNNFRIAQVFMEFI